MMTDYAGRARFDSDGNQLVTLVASRLEKNEAPPLLLANEAWVGAAIVLPPPAVGQPVIWTGGYSSSAGALYFDCSLDGGATWFPFYWQAVAAGASINSIVRPVTPLVRWRFINGAVAQTRFNLLWVYTY